MVTDYVQTDPANGTENQDHSDYGRGGFGGLGSATGARAALPSDCPDAHPQPYESIVADIGNPDALVAAFRGVDGIIHLAAATALNAPWDERLKKGQAADIDIPQSKAS